MFYQYLFILIVMRQLSGKLASKRFYSRVRGRSTGYLLPIIFHTNNIIISCKGWGQLS